MKVDIHFHVSGNGKDINNVDNDVYFAAEDNNHWFTRILYNLVEKDLKRLEADLNEDGKISTDEYFKMAYNLLVDSEEIDAIVLLAMDAVFSEKTGELDSKRTDLWVSNKFLYKKVKELNEQLSEKPDTRSKKFLFGASVSPNRKEWKAELEFVLNDTNAVLMKLVPSAQHIRMADKKHEEYFKILAANNMPLLSHVGPEYAFPEGLRNRKLDHFKYLKRALKCGVTVIAAHCASPVFPVIDKNRMKRFYKFMKRWNTDSNIRLWADTSALSLATRIHLIPDILKMFPPKWLVHGSDFPIPIDGWPHLPWITSGISPKEYIKILQTDNPLDRDVKIKRGHGFPDSIIDNSKFVLRMNFV